MNNKHKMKSRALVLSLVLSMVISLLPVYPLTKQAKADEISEKNKVKVEISSGKDKKILDIKTISDYYDNEAPIIYEPINAEDCKVDTSLSYREARNMLIDNPYPQLKGRITDEEYDVPEAYPAHYDDVENLKAYLTNELPPLRNQDNTGCCWAFSTISLIENYLLTNGGRDKNGDVILKYDDKDEDRLVTAINYSELQLAYSQFHNNTVPGIDNEADSIALSGMESFLDIGGNYFFAAKILNNWFGLVNELQIPFDTYMSFKDPYDHGKFIAEEGIDESVVYNSPAVHVTNSYYISLYNVDQVKEAIIENHAVGTNIYSNSNYYNDEHNAYYNYVFDFTNHAVNIVGWDDDFPKEYFTGNTGTGRIPKQDGAWLIRNSWVDTQINPDTEILSESGYFWISYEDLAVKNNIAFAIEAEPCDAYDNNYSYTPDMNINAQFEDYNIVANVFTVNGRAKAEQETIEAVTIESIDSNVEYSINIYSVDENGFPDRLIQDSYKATKGTIIYPGIYTIPLVQRVTLNKGDKFAVYVYTRSMNDGKGRIAIECSNVYWDGVYSVAGKNKGESFCFNPDNGQWVDIYDIESYDDIGNYCIQAITSDVGVSASVGVEGLKVTARTENSISLDWEDYTTSTTGGAIKYLVTRGIGKEAEYGLNSAVEYGEYDTDVFVKTITSESEYKDIDIPINAHCYYSVTPCDEDGEPLEGVLTKYTAAQVMPVLPETGLKTEIYTDDTELTNGMEIVAGTTTESANGYWLVCFNENVKIVESLPVADFSTEDGYLSMWYFDKRGLAPGIYSYCVLPYYRNLYDEYIYDMSEYSSIFDQFFVSYYKAPQELEYIYNYEDKSITLSWDKVDGAPGYKIYMVYEAEDGYTYYISTGLTDSDTLSFTTDVVYYLDDELEVAEANVEDDFCYDFAVCVCDPEIGQYFSDNEYSNCFGYSRLGFIPVYTTSKPEPDVSCFETTADDAVYDGIGHAVSIVPDSEIQEGDLGDITVYYTAKGTSEWTTDVPVNAGDYNFAVDVKEGYYFAKTEKLTDDSWSFTIAKKNLNVIPDAGQEKEEDDLDQALTYTYEGAVGNEIPVFTGSLSRIEGEVPGEYKIRLGTLDIADNYESGFLVANYNLLLNGVNSFVIKEVAALSALEATATKTSDSVTLFWNEVPKAKGYAIYDGNSEVLLGTTAELSYTVNGLTPDTDYGFTIYPYRVAEEYKKYAAASAKVEVRTNPLGSLNTDSFAFAAQNAEYDKTAHAAKVTSLISTISGNDITVYYRKNGTTTWETEAPVNAGSYDVCIDVNDTKDYNSVEKLRGDDWKLTIDRKEIGLEWGTTELIYNGSAQMPSCALAGIINDDTCEVTISGEQTIPGSYIAAASSLSNDNYKLPSVSFTNYTISKGDAGFETVPKAKEGLIYTGTALELIDFGNSKEGTILYAIGTDDNTAPESGWTENVITALDAGTYYVWYKILENNYYNGTDPVCVKTDIGRKSVADAVVALEKTDIAYNGAAQNILITSITVNGKELTADKDYTVSGNSGKSIGEYKLTITGIGNYKDFVDVIWKIVEPDAESENSGETNSGSDEGTSSGSDTDTSSDTGNTGDNDSDTGSTGGSDSGTGSTGGSDSGTGSTGGSDSGTGSTGGSDSGTGYSGGSDSGTGSTGGSDSGTGYTGGYDSGTGSNGGTGNTVDNGSGTGSKDDSESENGTGSKVDSSDNDNNTQPETAVVNYITTKETTSKGYKIEKTYKLSGDGAELVKYKTGTKSAIVPDTVEEDDNLIPVISIADKLFYKNKDITKIEIGKNVRFIGIKAFYKAKKAKRIYIYANKLEEIGAEAFKGISKNSIVYIYASKKDFKRIKNMLYDAGLSKEITVKRRKAK